MAGARVRDLEEIYRLRYRTFLRVTTAITGDVDAGHDAVQEGFAAALRQRASFRGWVAALPERQRLAVFLRYYADLDYAAIAEVLAVEVGTVSATLSSAHAALRKQIGEVTR